MAVTLASSSYFSGCVFPSGDDVVYGDMSLESLIKMQSSGVRSIDEANTPRPGGVSQGAVLVALDVTKDIATAAVYWALSNVVRRGDNLKICGIITHVSNPSTSDYLPSFFSFQAHRSISTRTCSFIFTSQFTSFREHSGASIEIMRLINVRHAVGFRTRVDKSSWVGNNGVMLQHEFNLKRNVLENIPHVKEWCDKAGVSLQRYINLTGMFKIPQGRSMN